VVELPCRGEPCLWSYGPINDQGTSILITVPTSVVVSEAEVAQAEALAITRRQLLATGMIFLVVLALVVAVAYRASRIVTRPVRQLTEAAGRIAAGDLDARAEVESGDEFQTLADAFNAMVPRLRENLEIRESLSLAREVQQQLLPAEPPDILGLDIDGESRYCDETGGDYFDYLDLTEQAPDRVGILVGDVSGHGIASALFMASARAVFRTRALREESPARLVTETNEILCRDSVEGRYMTLFYAVIDGTARMMRWVNAGHQPGLLYDPVNDQFEELKGEGIPLGIERSWEYRASGRAHIAKGQVLFVATDGIYETRDARGRMFGEAGVRDALRRNHQRRAREIRDAIREEVGAHRGDRPAEDDLTLVVVRFR
jgi:sigma-B regulation protein RsbU (phosphoserine phosphatase)